MDSKLIKNFSFGKKSSADSTNNTKSNNSHHSPSGLNKGLFSKLSSPFTLGGGGGGGSGGSSSSSASSSGTTTPTLENSTSSLDIPPPAVTEAKLKEDIQQCRIAFDHFLNSNIHEAECLLKPHSKDSLYLSLGYSFVLYLKSVMTFEVQDILTALDALKHTIRIAASLRNKKNGWQLVASWVKGTTVEDVKHMSLIERHAELVYAEAYLLKALLSIIHDESVMAFLRESMNIRSSYNTYMTLEKYIQSAKTPLDDDFLSGVYFGVGCFSIILSMLPSSVIKLAEFIGFTSDRKHGLSVLASVGGYSTMDPTKKKGAGIHGLRTPLCNIFLIAYHIILSKLVPLSEVNIPFAELVLKDCLEQYPKGVAYLYLNGRLMTNKKLLKEAEDQYQLAISQQKDWKQLQYMCFWELGLIYLIEHDWQRAYDIYSVLQKESNWSKAVYTYLRAISLYMLANDLNESTQKTEYMSQVVSLMGQVGSAKQKIAGKSIPVEKFFARKARKFLSQNNYLLLPDLEILNAFTAFDFIPANILENDILRINVEIDRLDDTARARNVHHFYDDYCLAQFFRGIGCRMLYEQNCNTTQSYDVATESLNQVFEYADRIELDHYIYYFSRYEMVLLYMMKKNYTKAEEEVQTVLKATEKGQYNIGAGPHAKNKYSLANTLAFKCHNCMTQIKTYSSS
ncbi:hypothetical protein BDF20DRAFT_981625 [Mycotypha africana]|uniref:uncharacterized protein n=1 Tax=Mycotypha africana TaxID=64632 RepID=UPI0022FFFD2B|nr:uncharacterized protein BDF20DRAFT_981625 [Mycotypha africana]KAI8968448.1 hypothetical protein BDF20DRAFT_981625 [Mycotypha africana]